MNQSLHSRAGPATQLQLYTGQSDPLHDFRLIPHWPSSHIYEIVTASKPLSYQSFSFAFIMLPSINRKHDNHQRVLRPYRDRERTEIVRIGLQRDLIDWATSSRDRYTIHYSFTVQTEIKQDIDNFLKQSCDLFGQGRWESKGSRKAGTYHRVYVPHAQIIWNDNRVMRSSIEKVIDHDGPQWCYVTIFKYDKADQYAPELRAAILQEEATGIILKGSS